MKRWIIIVLVIMGITSCQKEDVAPKEVTVDYIVFGHFYGECLGEECVEIFKLTENSLYEDTKDKYPGIDKAYDGNFILLDNSLFEKVKDLKAAVPDELIATNESVIGQPDAADWGGIYFEISSGGETRFWLLDKKKTNLPESLRPFVTTIEEKIALINN